MGKAMSEQFLRYLKKEHARLEAAIAAERARPLPDQLQVARLKKLKLAVRDQIAEFGESQRSFEAA
jgi:hypothetical protein